MHIHKPMTDLKFNVAQLLREDIGARRNYTFAEDALPLDDATILQQLEGKLRFTRTITGVRSRGVRIGCTSTSITSKGDSS